MSQNEPPEGPEAREDSSEAEWDKLSQVGEVLSAKDSSSSEAASPGSQSRPVSPLPAAAPNPAPPRRPAAPPAGNPAGAAAGTVPAGASAKPAAVPPALAAKPAGGPPAAAKPASGPPTAARPPGGPPAAIKLQSGPPAASKPPGGPPAPAKPPGGPPAPAKPPGGPPPAAKPPGGPPAASKATGHPPAAARPQGGPPPAGPRAPVAPAARASGAPGGAATARLPPAARPASLRAPPGEAGGAGSRPTPQGAAPGAGPGPKPPAPQATTAPPPPGQRAAGPTAAPRAAAPREPAAGAGEAAQRASPPARPGPVPAQRAPQAPAAQAASRAQPPASEEIKSASAKEEQGGSGKNDTTEASSDGGAAPGGPTLGWGGWATLGKLGATLQVAAATAVRDVTGLTESFTQALQEAAEAESDDETEPLARTAPSPEPELPAELAAKRAEVLQRLEAVGEQGAEEGGDRLAAGAGHALSSLWGWGTQLARRVEEAAASAARELTEGAADEGGEAEGEEVAAAGEVSARRAPAGAGAAPRAEFRLGAALGTLGRTAQQLVAGSRRGAGSAGHVALRGEEGGAPPSFDQAFYIYGGTQACEELEALSGECARTCNRVRARLPEAEQRALDAALRTLATLFDSRTAHAVDKQPPAPPRGLAQGHAIVQDLVAAGCEKAAVLGESCSKAALKPADEEGADGGGADDDPAAAAAQQAAAMQALEQLRHEGALRVAEACSLCVERLVALGRSLLAQFRYGRPADDGIQWPPAPEAAGALLRGQAQRMQQDMAVLAVAFAGALTGAAKTLDGQSASKPFGAGCQPLLLGLRADEAAAAGRVHDAFRGLMNVAWMTILDRELLDLD